MRKKNLKYAFSNIAVAKQDWWLLSFFLGKEV